MHDEMLSQLASPDIEGHVVLGIPDLYAAFMLPAILKIFRKAFPRVQLELNCSLSTPLVGCVKRGEVDIALVTRMNDFTGGQVVRQEQLIWMTGEQSTAHNEKPIPLALLPPGNIFRDHAIERLEASRLRWRIACVSHSVGGLQAAAFAGMAVTVLGRSALVPQHARDRRERRAAAAAEGRSPAVQIAGGDIEGRERPARLSRALSQPRRRTAARQGAVLCRSTTKARAAQGIRGRNWLQGRARSNAAAIRTIKPSSSQGAII